MNINLVSPNGSITNILKDIKTANEQGLLHILYENYLKECSLSDNLLIPYFDEISSSIQNLVVINHPDDAERLLEKHTQKTPYLKKLVFDSIISTTSVEHWREQRKHYQQAFSVKDELEQLIPISNARAIESIDTLLNLTTQCDGEYIDIHEFFLNETMAQLQLAMFGVSPEFEKESNQKIRNAFNGENVEYGKEYVQSLLSEIETAKGPLSNALRTRTDASRRETVGNSLIFSFAGHDTTANTLSWLIFEVAKNKTIYAKLQSEIDTFWSQKKESEPITYNDLKTLTYMTRCIMETLRLWTSIPNGTSRELNEDDLIIGKNGEEVKIPKGTYIQVPNWTRHRNPELWGDDVEIFNPERDFKEEEIFFEKGLNAYNPCSSRFSPFTYGPRDCIGKNFSQIEMRIILLHLFKHFTFSVPNYQLERYTFKTISMNKATLSPRNIYNSSLYDSKSGMYIKVASRNTISKL